MPKLHGPSRIAVVAVVVLAIGVSACGRRGALEPPPNAAATTAGHGVAAAAGSSATDETKPDKPFFLDFLI